MSQESAVTSLALPKKSFNIIFCASMMTTIGLTGMASVMPSIGRTLGIADTLVATIFSLSGLAFSFFAPFWAKMSDRHGRKPLMMLGTSGFVISMVSCAIVVEVGMARLVGPVAIFALLLIARGIFGIMGSANMPATQAYVAEHTSQENRTRSMAGLAGASNLGTVIGPVLASLFILSPLGLAGPMTGFAIMGAIVLALVFLFLPESSHRPAQPAKTGSVDKKDTASATALWKDKRFSPFLIYALTIFICQAAQAQTIGFVIIDKLGIDPIAAQTYIAVAMIGGAVAGTFAQWVIVRAFNMTPSSLMFWGAVLATVGNFLNMLQPGYVLVVAGYGVAAMGFAMGRPGYLAGASLALGKAEQARAAGAMAALAGFSAITNPIFVWLYGHFAWAPFAICTGIMGGMMVYALRCGALRNAVPKPVEPVQPTATGNEESVPVG